MNYFQERSLSIDDQRRLETLRLQKELERKEHERALWRQASSPLKTVEPQLVKVAQTSSPKNAEPQKPNGSLLSKLRLGRFLE